MTLFFAVVSWTLQLHDRIPINANTPIQMTILELTDFDEEQIELIHAVYCIYGPSKDESELMSFPLPTVA